MTATMITIFIVLVIWVLIAGVCFALIDKEGLFLEEQEKHSSSALLLLFLWPSTAWRMHRFYKRKNKQTEED